MKRIGRTRFSILGAILLLSILSACNMPRRVTPTQSSLDPISTFAAQTIEAQLTAISKPISTSALQTPQPTKTLSPGQVPSPSAESSTPTTNCNIAKFVKDVNAPDNTEFPPNTTFTKTWRLENAGTCTWTPEYKLVFYQGDKMKAPDFVLLQKEVQPGETVDISVTMTSPESPGAYKGEWKLRGPDGTIFGTGKNGNPIWVQILVVTNEGLDFISRAKSAYWRSGAPGEQITELTFNGNLDNPNGYAGVVEGRKMENGRMSGKVLLTVPRKANKGWTSGRYPPYFIQRGNHLEARIGFLLNSSGSCGNGKVLFQVKYMEGENVSTLGEWKKTCNGELLPIDIDLSRLAGKTVQFILSVKTLVPSQDNFAIWNSPQITK